MIPCKVCSCDLFTVVDRIFAYYSDEPALWLVCFHCGELKAKDALPASRYACRQLKTIPRTALSLHHDTGADGLPYGQGGLR